jgi:murein DD-endopeptidase MepM/ murein hydrolase activator NlpD
MGPLAVAAAALLLVAPAPGAPRPLRVRPGTLVRWPGADLEWCALGERRFEPLAGACYYPIDLLRPAGPLELARGRAGRRETATVQVGKFDYPVQQLTLPRKMVELSPADLARVQRENREMARLWGREGPRRFSLPLRVPLDPLPEGGRFGSRRIINGLPRSPHGGADYAAAEGTPALVVADGTVVMVADQFFGGNAVFVDHGDGLVTMYMHLLRVDVAEGQELRRGARVGAVGATGRATGPHLHFGARWRGARVDPALLLGDARAIPCLDTGGGLGCR